MFFSVIITTYNSQNTIVKTLNSVISQTFKDFEIILVDDSSSDKTIEYAEKCLKLSGKYYQIIKLKRNEGVANSRNIGIDKSHGLYIAFLDGDDLWVKEKLLLQYKFLVQNNYLIDWVFSNYKVVDSQYRFLGSRIRESGIYDYSKILGNGNPVGMLTTVVKSNLLKNNKFRNLHHEDYDLWIRLAKKGIVGYLMKEELGSYVKRSNSLSSNKLKSIIWTFRVFKANKIPTLKAFYLTVKYIFNYVARKR